MPRVCTICAHSDRNEIDAAIAAGEPNRRIAARYDLSEATVRRHRKHAAAIIKKALERREILVGDDIVDRLEKLYRCGEEIVTQAMRGGDGRLGLAAIAELRGVLAGLHTIARDAAAIKAASEPIRFRVMLDDKSAEPLAIPTPRHSLLN